MNRLISLLASVLLALPCSAREISLIWDANPPEDEVTHYVIYELTGAGWAKIGESESTMFVVGDRQPGRYEFAITAVSFWGESARSDSARTPAGIPAKPGVPRIDGAKRVALQSSPDLKEWSEVYAFNSFEAQEFYQVEITH